ncbi:MAG TPA: PIN domain-containing protein [Candidatus Wunengus sp. YC60]|uniref:PIN domain-containing protein n=1 Tax=Candidatus Wunengus sp. YC60 TaxID=3367697 RepID=UPI004027A82C
MKIYFDVCCLNRPFDNRIQDRIRFESEAILTILEHCQEGKYTFVSSEAVDIEIFKIPDIEKRQKVGMLSSISQSYIKVDTHIEKRAIELEQMNFTGFDALHIACAERGKVDILLTTDDNLIRKALRYKQILKIKIENPVTWLMEVTKR